MINNIIIFATEIVGSSYPMIRKFPNLLSPFSTTIWDKSKLVNMENEEWKDVVGYEGLYQVSNLGNVRMLEHYTPYVKGSVMKIPAKNLYIGWSNGYRTVWLCKNKIRKLKKVHRLVAEAFIPNPENKPCIDHINTIRHDNRIENLRWATYKENGNNEITKINLSNSQKGKPKNGLRNPVVKLNNNGLTFSNHLAHKSVIVIGRTSSAKEFEKTWSHESGHLADHICLTYDISPHGEEIQYLGDYIIDKTWDSAKKYLCDCCRIKK